MLDLAYARDLMVDRQIARRGVRDTYVLDAMREVPREAFVPQELREFAYEDVPLPIEASQTISQPYIVAVMIEAARIRPGDRVLEVGAGSGYAAAVISRIAAHVFGIERHAELATLARTRFEALSYSNIEIRIGDGTRGWAEVGPFDVIVAAAGGRHVPNALKNQLAIGGRLVMPIGETRQKQHLIKLTRTSETGFHQEDLEDVRFVPLIGEEGWQAEAPVSAARKTQGSPASITDLIDLAAEPLPAIDDPAFGRLFDRFASAKLVLLGEASHGTSEFYRARAAITRRLIEEHGFTIVAVEADWPDAASLDRYVRLKPEKPDGAPAFTRFPTWMWRNKEVMAFTKWLRNHNSARPADQRAGFYGLDLYSLAGSIRAVIDYLDRVDSDAAAVARERYGCLTPWAKEPQTYGRMALSAGYARCEQPVTTMLRDLLAKRLAYSAHDGEAFLDASQNARLVRDAEVYYRAMYYGAAESWNLRDRHMFESLESLLAFKGASTKAVVWAHNSHIGDARSTEMGIVREELNLGQLCREHFGVQARLIGFGTHTGTVAAASDWDAPMEVKPVNPSRPDSYERLAHDARLPAFLLDLREGVHEPLRHALAEPRLERFIGVIYRPETERWSHYSECNLPGQFDAYVWFDETSAVTPLPTVQETGGEETYPFGL